MNRWLFRAALLLSTLTATHVHATPDVQPLSLSALEAMVAGVALYPDDVVEQVLAAAQHPASLHKAASASTAGERRTYPASVAYVAQFPGLLQQLDASLPLTARLGVAAQTQIEDVWQAVDNVRDAMAAAAEPIDGGYVEGGVYSESVTDAYLGAGYPVPYIPYAAIVYAGYWAHHIHHELAHATAGAAYQYVATGAVTISGPYNSTSFATAAGARGRATWGTSSTSGPRGNAATTSFAGAAYNNGASAGAAAAFETSATGPGGMNVDAQGQGTVSAHQNPDGSIAFGGEQNGSLSGSGGGYAQASHHGSGVYTGDGGGSYQGGSTIDTSQGRYSTSTNAGSGQATTSVTNPAGQTNTYTAGDGQIGNPSASGEPTSRMPSAADLTGAFGRPGGAHSDTRTSFGRSQQPFSPTRTLGSSLESASGHRNLSAMPTSRNLDPTTPSFGARGPTRGGGGTRGGRGRRRGR